MSEATETRAGRRRPRTLGTGLGFLALVVAVATVALWFRQVDQVAIPENRTVFVVVFLTAAALGIAAFVAGTRWFGGVAAVVAIIIGAFLPFTMAISRQEVGTAAIQVGDVIPHFTALDEHGQTFDSRSLDGRITLIKFFRAHW